MRLIKLSDLCGEDLFFGRPEVFPESWESRPSFSQYKDNPRPCHALFFVKTDIRVEFFLKNDMPVTARKGDVVFIPQGSLYHVAVDGGTPDSIDTYTVNFGMQDHRGEALTLSERICVLCGNGVGVLDMHFQKLSQAAHIGTEINLLRLRAELYTLLDAIVAAAAGLPDVYCIIRNGAEALRTEWNQSKPIERYAALCGISETYFYRCFREWSGKSPVEYRNALRLSNAKAMLRHTDMKISEIAGVVGFEDPFYFSRSFTKIYGLSPKAYRAARGD